MASPVELIVATTSSELVHVNSTSGTAVPSSVVAAAWNSCMPPTSTEAEDGLTVTTATTGSGGGGSVTCTVAVPDRSPAVAVIVTSPAWIPVASPVELIVATTSSELVHVNSTSGTAVPSSVVAAAWNSCMPPTSTEAEDGLTVTTATMGGGGPVTVTATGELRTPSTSARIMATPAATAVASPSLLMATTPVLLLDHNTFTSSRIKLSAVRAVAVNVRVSSTVICCADDGLTDTLTTGDWVTVIVTSKLDTPFATAFIVVEPAATAVATPSGIDC